MFRVNYDTIFILAELSLKAMLNSLAFLNGGLYALQKKKKNGTIWKFLYNVPYFIFSKQLGKEPQYKYFQHTLENIINHANMIHSQNKTSLQVIKVDKMFSNPIHQINMHLNRGRPLSWTLIHIVHTIPSYKCLQSVFKAARVYTF